MLAAATMIMSGCNGNNNQSTQTMSNISEETVGRTVQAIVGKCPQADRALVQKGVAQAAALWRAEDGTEAEFGQFAAGSYAATPEDRKVLFDKLSAAFETLYGTSNQVAVRLQAPCSWPVPSPRRLTTSSERSAPIRTCRMTSSPTRRHLSPSSISPSTPLRRRIPSEKSGAASNGPTPAWETPSPPAYRPPSTPDTRR